MNTEIKKVKEHFENEAAEFDEIIKKLIPYYNEMIEALVSVITFDKDKEIKVIDLGCGTGTIAKEIKKEYPNAKFTCVDIAENMLKMAELKLGKDVKYIKSDFNNFIFPEKYDLIVSSLALHHLSEEKDVDDFYKKIYNSLNSQGIFINADVVLGSTKCLQDIFIEKWMKYMNKSISIEEIENKWMVSYYSEDRPISIMKHLELLRKSNFRNIDIIWKYYNYAVYRGEK